MNSSMKPQFYFPSSTRFSQAAMSLHCLVFTTQQWCNGLFLYRNHAGVYYIPFFVNSPLCLGIISKCLLQTGSKIFSCEFIIIESKIWSNYITFKTHFIRHVRAFHLNVYLKENSSIFEGNIANRSIYIDTPTSSYTTRSILWRKIWI